MLSELNTKKVVPHLLCPSLLARKEPLSSKEPSSLTNLVRAGRGPIKRHKKDIAEE